MRRDARGECIFSRHAVPYQPSRQVVHLPIHTQKLERIYQNSLRAVSATQEREEQRQLRLRIALLETENDELRDWARERESEIEVLQSECNSLTEQLHATTQSCEAAHDEVRVKTRQNENLQVYNATFPTR